MVRSEWWKRARVTFENVVTDYITRARAAETRELGHECGHQFTFTISMVGHSSGVKGENPPVHDDANYASLLKPVTVRAHSLRDAFLVAATLPMAEFIDTETESDRNE